MLKAVRVFRLANGEDIVADARQLADTKAWELTDPMRIIYNTSLADEPEMDGQSSVGSTLMMLAPWLMPSVVRSNTVIIADSQIVFVADITDKVHSYYTKITNLFNMIKSGKKLTLADLGVETDSDVDFSMDVGEEKEESANNESTVDLDVLKKKAGRLLH